MVHEEKKDEEASKLPDIKSGAGVGADLPEIISPFPRAEMDSQSPDAMRRSFSPNKTFVSNMSRGNGTMTNFYFKQDKEKMDAAAERLIHSVNAVTDLLKANTNLRENIERI